MRLEPSLSVTFNEAESGKGLVHLESKVMEATCLEQWVQVGNIGIPRVEIQNIDLRNWLQQPLAGHVHDLV